MQRVSLWMGAIVVLGACAGSYGEDAVDGVDDAFYTPDDKADGFTATPAESCAVLRLANEGTAIQLDDDAGLDGRAASAIVARRPFATLEALDAAPYVGPVAFDKLLDFAESNGFTCADAPPPACSATGGTYDGVTFTASEECHAVDFLDHARFSEMGALTATARRIAYDGCPAGMTCTGYRMSAWPTMKSYADTSGIAGSSVKSVRTAAASWVQNGLPYDTVANLWAGRQALVDGQVTLDKVWVTRGGIVETGTYTYYCDEVRDRPGASTYLAACFQYINADSASPCNNGPACADALVGRWVWLRGTLRRSSLPGGYKINLLSTGAKDANPAIP